MVHDHTYYLAQPNETFGANPALGAALRRIWQARRVTTACGTFDGASIWHSGGKSDPVRIRVVRTSAQPGHVEVLDVEDVVIVDSETRAIP